MATITIDNGQYTNLNNALPDGSTNIGNRRISNSSNIVTNLKDGDEATKLVNVVEIDWNGAVLDKSYKSEPLSSYIGHPANSTGDILSEVSHQINEIEFADILYKYLKSDNIDINIYKDKNESHKKLYIGNFGEFVISNYNPFIKDSTYDYANDVRIIDYDAETTIENFTIGYIDDLDNMENRTPMFDENNEQVRGFYLLIRKDYRPNTIRFIAQYGSSTENMPIVNSYIAPESISPDPNKNLYKITTSIGANKTGILKITVDKTS